ncbi:MAG: hypothetical protein HZB16_09925 [Armatimonadetes bacterium]|nr:hypothetical protein [Armatimonadota bacterium]
MDDRHRRTARLRELSGTQRERALTHDELVEAADHFRALGDPTRAAQALKAAEALATSRPKPLEGAPPWRGDPRSTMVHAHALRFGCGPFGDTGRDVDRLLAKARAGHAVLLNAVMATLCDLICAQHAPPVPMPVSCAVCGQNEPCSVLAEEVPHEIHYSTQIEVKLLMMSIVDTKQNGRLDQRLSVAWPLCGTCKTAVAEHIDAIGQVRSRLLAAKGSGDRRAARRGRTNPQAAQDACEALDALVLKPLPGGAPDLPTIRCVRSTVHAVEASNTVQWSSCDVSRTIEYVLGSHAAGRALEAAVAGEVWRAEVPDGGGSVRLFDVVCDLAERLGRYRLEA